MVLYSHGFVVHGFTLPPVVFVWACVYKRKHNVVVLGWGWGEQAEQVADWVFLKSAFVKHGMGYVDSCLDTWKCIGGFDVSEVFIVTLGWLI